ncbi:MAG: hypothetical protein DMF87_20215 [Acidobacteria bacterium]|nr:MAG: hypothetical protein DMF87_20215 [Acidobacteriota bacterium]
MYVYRRGQPCGSQLIGEAVPSPEVSFECSGSPAAFFSPIVASKRCLPHAVNGGAAPRNVAPNP